MTLATSYTLLPFRFERIDQDRALLTNDVGEFLFLSFKQFEDLISGRADTTADWFKDAQSHHIATVGHVEDVIKMLAVKLRTKKSPLKDFTSLHMVVPTLRCNSSCIYCQVARKNLDDHSAEMSKRTAKNVVRTIFKSPSPVIKIEFQGGEPTTEFELVKYIIEEAELVNILKHRKLEFVICTNMTLLTPEMVKYLKKHNCNISSSLDGPQHIHDINRPLQGNNSSYEQFQRQLQMVRETWGSQECVSALMTTSSFSIGHFKEIIDEYVSLGFNSIFLRSLNPYGFAKQYKDKIGYPIESFIESFKEALDYIIDLNLKGTFISEGYTTILLKRILTPFATGFVDLQSPAGVGIAGAIYDYDGSVYVSDEGRMMARFGNKSFRIGNVNTDSYQSMFNGERLHEIMKVSCNESLPGCADCVFQPYCGADPVRNLSEQGDMVGYRPTNEMCKKNKAIFRYLFEKIFRNDPDINKVFWSWINTN